MKKICRNKISIILFLILIIWIIFSFFEVKESMFKKYDTITVFFYISAFSSLSMLSVIAPIIVMTIATYQFHKEFQSGFVKYELLRMNYKDYIKSRMKKILCSTWILPTSMAILFILCFCLTRNFNFENAIPKVIRYASDGTPIMESTISTITTEFYKTPVQLMFTYFIVIILHSIFYANLAFIMCRNNRSFLVVLLESFIIFIAIGIVSEIFMGYLSAKLKLTFLSGVFNLLGIWVYCDYSNLWAVLIYSIFLAITSTLIARLFYKNKERVLMCSEK